VVVVVAAVVAVVVLGMVKRWSLLPLRPGWNFWQKTKCSHKQRYRFVIDTVLIFIDTLMRRFDRCYFYFSHFFPVNYNSKKKKKKQTIDQHTTESVHTFDLSELSSQSATSTTLSPTITTTPTPPLCYTTPPPTTTITTLGA
jgi:hypothetical protein